MDRDLTTRDAPAGQPDDAQLGVLVKAVAEDWRQPPRRLGQPTWREHVEVDRRGSGGGGRRWFGRLAGAGMLALVATVVLSVTAVYLTGPRPNQSGLGASPSPRPTSRASQSTATPSSIPAVITNGDLPGVTRVLLQDGEGYRFADLTTGKLEPELPWAVGYASRVMSRPGGGWVCLCVAYVGGGTGSPAALAVSVKSMTASGALGESRDVRSVTSQPGQAASAASDTTKVDVHVDPSLDGRSAYVGWSRRVGAGWAAGVDMVDLTSLAVVRSIDLPNVDRSATATGLPWVRLAPMVSLDPEGRVALISSDWFVNDPTTASPPHGTDRWSATVDGTDAAVAVDEAVDPQGAPCSAWQQGLIDDASYFVACSTQSGEARVDRFKLDGSAISRDAIGGWAGGFGLVTARSGSRLFLWDAQTHKLVRFDLSTGKSDSVTVPATARMDSPLDMVQALGRSLGHWIAPTASAKNLLQPALALSPDGKTLYALGIGGDPGEGSGSAGVFVFDVSGHAPLLKDHWGPTADFVSIAVSEDGAFVYVAGRGGVGADGIGDDSIAPSVTVLDARDGSVRLLAGRLDGSDLLFVEPVVR